MVFATWYLVVGFLVVFIFIVTRFSYLVFISNKQEEDAIKTTLFENTLLSSFLFILGVVIGFLILIFTDSPIMNWN